MGKDGSAECEVVRQAGKRGTGATERRWLGEVWVPWPLAGSPAPNGARSWRPVPSVKVEGWEEEVEEPSPNPTPLPLPWPLDCFCPLSDASTVTVTWTAPANGATLAPWGALVRHLASRMDPALRGPASAVALWGEHKERRARKVGSKRPAAARAANESTASKRRRRASADAGATPATPLTAAADGEDEDDDDAATAASGEDKEGWEAEEVYDSSETEWDSEAEGEAEDGEAEEAAIEDDGL